ncbi:MAG: 4-(cytidine 5'-diphospho)-2-C-methyl-D-erythritol kinase [Actinomycetota bacterium]
MTTQPQTVVVEAPAKVNLFLHVVGKREDGYHLLDSLVCFAGVGDTLEMSDACGLSLTVDGPTAGLLPPGEDNIVLRVARRLAERTGRAANAAIRLTKRLPVAAGIGGGSADAAAVLKGLDRLWNTALPEDEMRALALSIGADVPVCVRGRATHMAGVGEVLSDTPALPPAWLVLVNPMVPLSTPAVFKARAAGFSDPAPLAEAPADARALAQALELRRNDLTDPAMALAPVVGEVLDAIARSPGPCLLARMSGSGATCFGLYADEAAARAASTAIAKAHPAWWTAAAPLLG